MKYFPILEMPEEIQAFVVERVAGNFFQDPYGLRASCKLMKAFADRRRVCHFYDVLSVPWGLNMPAELLKTCYAERNPSTLYIKGVQFVFTLYLEEEGVALMKLAADSRYERTALVVERVASNSFQDFYGLRALCKLMRAFADRRRVCHFYDVLSVPWGLNMHAELLKTCYAERNPSTLYIKGVQFVFTLNLEEEGVALMKLAADAGYERVVYTHAMTRKTFWDDDEGYFARFPRESVIRIGKLVRSVKWGWGLWHGDAFRAKRAEFISTVNPSFCSCQCAPLLKRECLCLWHIDTTKDDNMCDHCFWIKENLMDLGCGIPRRCDCGADTVVLTSNTARNPGRRFYRCGEISGENNVFKWLDEAHDEDFVVVANKLATMEKDLADMKADLADMKNDISEIVALIDCQCAPLLKRECLCLWHIDTTKDDNMCDRCFWIKVNSMDLGRGIPRRCDCGAGTVVLMSNTARNPGRRFYRCGAISGENHVFKWLDEAHDEEFVVVANKLATMEQDLADIKADLADMKNDISGIILELPKEIQALVVERVAGNSFQDLYGLRASCKLMKALADRRSGVQFFFTFNLQEEGRALMKLAADEGYERAVYTYAMTRNFFGVMRSIFLALQGNQLIGSGN
ncbi:hypothetical protein F2Q70_00027453 [Brassica cretica]|uniref:GRF-type domain-containing protein n=1 Tax=Brassica cretica TaxID=69181 RepID=A0A8S9LBQ7_BRACR|nr:hypothetical protein F2Q70_00027453 [Brassica cretica]